MKENSLLKNSIYNVLYKLLNAVFPLVSATYASHVILASGIGKVSSAQNIAQYFVIIAALGIPNYGIREIAKVKDNKKRTNQVFSELFVISLISTLACTVVYYLLIGNISMFSSERLLYRIVGITVILNIINVDWFYQGTEEFGYIAKRSFVVKLFSLVGLFVFVRNINDYSNYALINVLATAGNFIFNIINLRKRNISLTVSDIHIKKHLKPVFILLCTSIAIELYTLLDTTMLTFLSKEENVGYYSNSMKIVKVLITIITAIGGVLLPRLSYYYKNGKKEECNAIINKVFSVMLFLFIPCGIGIILTADILIPVLFGTSFFPAITTTRISALLIYALGFSNLFGTQILLTFDCEKKLFLCTVVGAASNIIMNWFFIPLYQQNGAAVASVISEALVTILTFTFSTKYVKYKIDRRFVLTSSLACVLMVLGVWGVKLIVKSNVVSLVLSVGCGIIIYLIANVILKNPILNDLLTIVRKNSNEDTHIL